MSNDEKELSVDSSTQPAPEISVRKRPVSERKLEANQRNALLSTGPKTARGKRNAARNAIKHGLLAREVVITAGDGEESLKDFQDLLGNLWEYYQPVGTLEKMLVERIGTCWLRLARVTRAETGEIRKQLDNLGMYREFRNLYSDYDSPLAKLCPGDLAKLIALLEQARDQMQHAGNISPELRSQISDAFRHRRSSFAEAINPAPPREPRKTRNLADLIKLRPVPGESGKIDSPAESGKSDSPQPVKDIPDEEADRKRATLLKRIDNNLEDLRVMLQRSTKRYKLEAESEARSLSLPPADVADKIMRYEAHLDRQLQRTMDQLERLQRQRRGDKVPPPLNISLRD
jgi:hypothetical protein